MNADDCTAPYSLLKKTQQIWTIVWVSICKVGLFKQPHGFSTEYYSWMSRYDKKNNILCIND